jgi:putative addiction module killer protein
MVYTFPMRTVLTTEVFDTWFAGLTDGRAKARVSARIRRAEEGNLGDCGPVGEGVSEMRIHYGPGYRVYFVQSGFEIVILLAGGDKSTQSKDIKGALKLAEQLGKGEHDGH